MLFGIGDGGGGPTRSHLERMQRIKDVRGLPRVSQRSPVEFFAALEEDAQRSAVSNSAGFADGAYSTPEAAAPPGGLPSVSLPQQPASLLPAIGGGLPKWVGELYFERHRGTYTTQGATKRGNRLCQTALHDAELLAVAAAAATAADGRSSCGFVYPKAELERLWKLVLLNQFRKCHTPSLLHMAQIRK